MEIIVRIAILFLLFLCSFAISCNSQGVCQRYCNIFIGTNSDAFNYEIPRASGDKIEGHVFIFINNNPVEYYGGYGKTIQVNQWLKPEQNNMRIVGVSSRDLFVKVVSSDVYGGNSMVLAKFQVQKGNVEESFTFNVKNIVGELPLFNSIISSERSLVKEELTDEVIQLKKDIESNNETEIVRKMLIGPSLWYQIAYNVDWEEIEENLKKRIINLYSHKTKVQIDLNRDELEFVFGENSVYVYSSIGSGNIPAPFLFTVEGSKKVTVPAVKLIKYNDEWIIWH